MIPAWKEEIIIRSFDVDCKNQMKISSLCSYFQEVAGHHAAHLGLGFEQMRREGLFWVLSRLEISFIRFPEWNDHLTIETWPSGHERLFYRREFLVAKEGGEKLITAVSFWLLININSRRPKILPLPEGIEQHNAGRTVMQVMTEPIPSPTGGETVTIPVQYGDLDLNQHVNNVRYMQWITDLFPVDFHYRHVPVFFRIDFKQEVKANEWVQITKKGDGKDFILEGKESTGQMTCFQAVISFRET
jgi:acyl-ACP thioesterase